MEAIVTSVDFSDELIILPLLVGGSLASGLILRLYRHRGQSGTTDLIITIALSTGWLLLYAAELVESNLPEKLFWAKLQYLCIAGVAPAWFTYVVKYVRSQRPGEEATLDSRVVAALYVIPVLIQPFVWTNERHHLLWPGYTVAKLDELLIIRYEHGPVFYLINFYSLALLAAGCLLLLRYALRDRQMFFGHRMLILGSTVLPFSGNLLYILNVPWLGGIDPTPFMLIVAASLLAFALIRYGGVELVALARDKALDLFPHAVLVVKKDLTLLEVNEAALHLVDRTRRQLLGRPLHAVLPTEPALRDLLEGREEHGDPIEVVFTPAGRERRILDIRTTEIGGGKLVQHGKIVVLEDVTWERSIEKALRDSEAQFRTLVNHVPGVVYNSRGWPHDDLHYLSEFVETLTGYPATAFAPTGPRRFSSIIHPDDRGGAAGAERPRGRQGLSQEYRLVHKDGSLRWILDRAEEIEAGELVEGLLFDITDRKAGEEMLCAARDDARAASRAKSAFLANMSHEIRTPMNGILGMAQLLLRSDLGREQRERTELIVRSGENLLTILNDILDLIKIEFGKLAIERYPFNFRDCIWEASALFTEAAGERGLKFSVQIAADLPRFCVGDQVRLRQILNNLLSNAVKFTHEGEIHLDVRRDGVGDADRPLLIEVRDTGIGMAPEQLERIQHAFEQADTSTTKEYGGAGLGVTITIQLAELMGGAFTIESEAGRGTCIQIRLPLEAAEELETNGAAPSKPAETAGGGPISGRILVVDDNGCNREVAVGLLSEMIAQVDVACNGQEAVDCAMKVQYDAIFLDVQMPVMDGYTATRHIREISTYAAVPIIAMTASAMQEDRLQCREAGMTDFLAKPLRVGEIRSVISRHLESAARRGDTAPPAAGGKPAEANPMPDLDGPVLPEDIFDRNEVEALLGHNPSLIANALDNFCPALNRVLDEYREAIGAQDMESAYRAIHSLKSVAAYLGGRRLQDLAAHMEAQYKDNAPAEAESLLAALETECDALIAAVTVYRAQASGATPA